MICATHGEVLCGEADALDLIHVLSPFLNHIRHDVDVNQFTCKSVRCVVYTHLVVTCQDETA